MKKLVLMICVLFSIGLSAQKITKNIIDEFTGSRIIETSDVDISNDFWCSMKKVNNVYFLNLYFNGGNNIYTMNQGDEFLLKLEGGGIISLKNNKMVVSEYVYFTVGSTTISHFTISPTFIIDEVTLKVLKNTKILNVRLHFSDKYSDGLVKEKNSIKLMKMFSLID